MGGADAAIPWSVLSQAEERTCAWVPAERPDWGGDHDSLQWFRLLSAYACRALPIMAGFFLFHLPCDAGRRRRMQQGRSGALDGGRVRGMVVRGT
jgi:hypothetical protein